MDNELDLLLGMMTEEIVYDWAEIAHDQIHRAPQRFFDLNPNFTKNVRAQFQELLKNRSMSTLDYFNLTGVDVEDDRQLYEFLTRSYDYLFEGKYQDDPPHPLID